MQLSPALSGESGFLSRTTAWRRYDLVAASLNGAAIQVKRLAGLPGESLAIIQGDLWVNGRVLRKNWPQFCSQAILVHDDRFRLAGQSRWRPVRSLSRWRWVNDSWRGAAAAGGAADDWLAFRPCAPALAAGQEPAIAWTDIYAENQNISRTWRRVSDVAIAARTEMSADAIVELQLTTAREALTWRLDCGADTATAILDGRPLVALRAAGGARRAVSSLVWGVWDRQAMLVLNHQLAWSAELPESAAPVPTHDSQAAVQIIKGAAALMDLRCLRDIYYLPKTPGRPWTLSLNHAEVALLGDNQPYAIDARHYGAAPLAVLLGKVKPQPLAGDL